MTSLNRLLDILSKSPFCDPRQAGIVPVTPSNGGATLPGRPPRVHLCDFDLCNANRGKSSVAESHFTYNCHRRSPIPAQNNGKFLIIVSIYWSTNFMRQPLSIPSEERQAASNISRFIAELNLTHDLQISSYADLYRWSVDELSDFWAVMWEFGAVRYSRPYDVVLENVNRFPGAKWFPGARLNFAENLLRYRDDRLAIIFRGETQTTAYMTYAQLYDAVARLAKSLRASGVGVGDRVVGYMPNLPETAIAMLATASLGAVWSSCATDIGPAAALERLGQVEPKVMFTADGYYYKGKTFDTLPHAAEVARGISSLSRVVVVSYTRERPDLSDIRQAVHWEDFLSRMRALRSTSSSCRSTTRCSSCSPPAPPAGPSAWCRARAVCCSTISRNCSCIPTSSARTASSTSPPAVG